VRRLTAAALTSVALAALSGPAAAGRPSVYNRVLQVYQAQSTIPPCTFSSAELATALRGIDTYGQQYFADFSAAIQGALAARAAGACAPSRHQTAQSQVPVAAGPALPSSPTAATEAGIPLVILLLGGLGLALAAAAALVALTRGLGWEPAWLPGWRHACAEAGYRISGGWSNLADRWRARR
jgi:hypothetical protein